MKCGHVAEIRSNKASPEDEPKIIAYRGKSGNIYFPALFGLTKVSLGIENGKLRVFSAIDPTSCVYTPIYQGDEEFTITIK